MGILNFFKEWGTAFKVSSCLTKSIETFPHNEKYVSYLEEKGELLSDSIDSISSILLDGLKNKINHDNIDKMGSKYIHLWNRIIGDYKMDEAMTALNKIDVERFALTKINDDQALSPEEIGEIIDYCKLKGIDGFVTEESLRKEFDYFIRNWNIDNGLIEEVEPDFIMQKNEKCYLSQSTELLESKNLTRRINFSGPRVRIPIMKGLSYNIGSYDVRTKNESVNVPLGSGMVNITNKRVICRTEKKNIAIRLSAIIGIDPFVDAVTVHRSNANPITFKPNDAIVFYQMLNGIIRNA